MTSQLRSYQLDGVSFLANSPSALLADQMGLGKTVQACTALRVVHGRTPGARSLVVAPASLLRNWEEELGRWAPEFVIRRLNGSVADRRALLMLPIAILLASYEQIRIDAELIGRARPFDVVLLDEAQRVKNSSSAAALACRTIPRTRSWALSGTPLENSADELVSVFGFVMPGLLSTGMPADEVHARVKPHFLRRTKREVLGELPPMDIQDLPLELSAPQRRAYDELWETRYRLSKSPHSHLLALVTKLKQLCNRDPSTNESSKLDALRIVMEDAAANGEKVLLFSQYVETLNWLAESLCDYHPLLYHGGMTEDSKSSAINAFKRDSNVALFLVSLKAGGVGLNLNEASTVVLFDRWWNPATEAQAMERAHRFGRKGSLLVLRFVVRDTIEERIQEVLGNKQDIFDEYVEDAPVARVKALSAGQLRQMLELPQSADD